MSRNVFFTRQQWYIAEIWHLCVTRMACKGFFFFSREHMWIITTMKRLLFHCQESDIHERWHCSFTFCAVLMIKICSMCAKLNRQASFAAYFSLFSACRLKHLMGFLLREVKIREKLAVHTVPCLTLISVSICAVHCFRDTVGIRFVIPGEAFLHCFFLGVCKLSV